MISNNERKLILQTCINNIKHQSNLMKSNLNNNKLLQALKHCSNFLNELRSNNLTPKQYYEIYMLVFDSLEILSSYLVTNNNNEINSKKSSIFLADLYEIVQYSGNIIPRLYMMINVGTTYMTIENAPVKDLMKDMIEMCHGVQHPIRGLFLRYYLSQRTKNLLPFNNESELNETVDFLIANFIEMNKLWVRLQHQGHSSERELRYKERKELKILVGSNLVRLSQIIDDYQDKFSEFSSKSYYQEKVFSIITEQIIQCKDHLAQSYLIDVIIQIFPIEYHILTLDELLDVFLKLHPMLRKSELIDSLIERLINNNEEDNELSEETFDQFWSFYSNFNDSDPTIPIEEHSNLLKSFIKLSLSIKNHSDDYVTLNLIYKFASENLSTTSEEDEKMWCDLLIEPINHFQSIKSIFKLDNFYAFYQKIQNKNLQKKISIMIIDKMLLNNEYLKDLNEIDSVFKYLLILIKENPTKLNTAKHLGVTKTIKINDNSDENLISLDFLQIQEKICKVIQLIENCNASELNETSLINNLSNLFHVRKRYLNKNLQNIIFTYPTLVSKILFKLKILGYLKAKEASSSSSQQVLSSNFKNLSLIVEELYANHQESSSSTILKLYLNIANVADQLKLQQISFEIYNQCFVIYEESLIYQTKRKGTNINPHDSLSRGSIAFESILSIVNSLVQTRHLEKTNYEDLITKLTLQGSKLLKKQDQCRAVYSCCNLWWWTESLLPKGEKSSTLNGEKEHEEEKTETKETNEEIEDKASNVEENKTHKNTIQEEEVLLFRDGKRVLECLQKSLRIADSCMDPYLSLKLFIEILNRCLVFNIYGNDSIDYKYLNGLIELIKTNIENLSDEQDQIEQERNENDTEDEDGDVKETILLKQARNYFIKTLEYIKEQQASEEGGFSSVNTEIMTY